MKAKDLIGERFGRLVVTGRADDLSRKNPRWNCICDCGVKTVSQGGALRSGAQKSCGCLQREVATKHGMENTLTYTTWAQMKSRCMNPKHRSYPGYGGRGITVCARWMMFESFLEDMGEKPKGKYSIDRVDNNGGYCKENCRWTDSVTQNNNRRNTAYYTHEGKTQSLTLWARERGMPAATVKSRIRLGWNIEDALNVEIDKSKSTKQKR